MKTIRMKNLLILTSAIVASSSIYAAENVSMTILFEKDPNFSDQLYDYDCCSEKKGVVVHFPKKPNNKELIGRIEKMLPHMEVKNISSTEDKTIAVIRPKLTPIYLAYLVDVDAEQSIDDLPKTVKIDLHKESPEFKDFKKKLPHFCHLVHHNCVYIHFNDNNQIKDLIIKEKTPITPEGKAIPEGELFMLVEVCPYKRKDYFLDAGHFIKGDAEND